MPVVPEDIRSEAMARLGLSDALIRLSEGELIHPAFAQHCQAPPRHCYDGFEVPDGPEFVPIWDEDDQAFGVREAAGGLEFLSYWTDDGLESIIARTEQGFLAYLFNEIYDTTHEDDEDDLAMLREAAQAIGFRFLDDVIRYREEVGNSLDYLEERRFEKEVCGGIDAAVAAEAPAGPKPRRKAVAKERREPWEVRVAGFDHPGMVELVRVLESLFAGKVESDKVVAGFERPGEDRGMGIEFRRSPSKHVTLRFFIGETFEGHDAALAAVTDLGLPSTKRRAVDPFRRTAHPYREFRIPVRSAESAARLAVAVLTAGYGLGPGFPLAIDTAHDHP